MSRIWKCFLYKMPNEHIPIALIKFLQSAVLFHNRIEKSKSSHSKVHQSPELNNLKALYFMAVFIISLCRSRTFNQFSRSKAEYPVFYPHLRSNTFHNNHQIWQGCFQSPKSTFLALFVSGIFHCLKFLCLYPLSLFVFHL